MPAANDPLLDGLTEPQRRAVTRRDGALLVLAGPGSGKTTVVTRRMACLIAGGVEPWRILALTFTNKAAGEMRQRVDALLPGHLLDRRSPTVATFHSFCARQLRRHAEAAGLAPGYSIYDEADRREALKQAIQAAGLSSKNWTPAAVGSAISGAKNLLLDAEGYAAAANDFRTRSISRVYKAYQRIMRAADALDFDDLLLRMARALRESEPLRSHLQQRYRYLMIDEYQDTNHAQFMIAHTLAAAHGNICVVGDPDQSIYGWRGADISNILQFEEHHPDAEVVALGQNFRSTGHIVDASAGLIANNRRRKHKKLFTDLEAGERARILLCADEHHEASLVTELLRGEHDRGVPWKEMAVLYRVNALSRVLEEGFRDAGIPYVIARGTAFYERKEIKDALAYLRLVANGKDEVSLRRIVNTPPRAIGKTTLGRVELAAMEGGPGRPAPQGLLETMRAAGAIGGLSPRAASAVTRFAALVDGLAAAAQAPVTRQSAPQALAALVERVIRDSGLEGMYRQPTDEDRQRRENLEELISAAAGFEPPAPEDESEAMTLSRVLSLFLESVALVSDADMIDPESGTVTLMSLHAAKGLEFAVVAMVGLEENLLPHARAAESDLEMEEERRLCFVGMTRAKRRLVLTRAMRRTHRGMRAATIESRFLGELPAESIQRSDESGGLDATGDAEERWTSRRLANVNPGAFPVGCIVRHPRFGLGRVEAVTTRASGAGVRVAFPSAGVKNLVLDFAPLERVDEKSHRP